VTGSFWVPLPLACLIGGAFVVYLVARLLRAPNSVLALCTAVVFGVGLMAVLSLALIVGHSAQSPTWGRMTPRGTFLLAEPGALMISGIALGLGMLVALFSGRYLALDRRYETFYPLLLLLVTGLAGMVLAGDLFNLYMFCELMSISAYTLVAFRRHTDTAIEAGFKYLIMGSAGTTILLLGISFVYRASGRLTLPVTAGGQASIWTRAGLACFLVGLGVKSALVPLHTWLPDAHGRAPSSVSAMLSGIIIQSTFYVLLKTSLGLGLPAGRLGTLLIVLSSLNMTLGNSMALVQTNTKRLLAYSTVAQMGYVMFGVGIGLRHSIAGAIGAGFFMLLAHAAMKGLAFLCKGVCHFCRGATEIAQLRGISRVLPLVGVALSVALAGLSAVPPLAGFAGKWLMVTQILRSADWLVYVGLAVFLLNGAVSLGYYLPVIGVLFTQTDPPLSPPSGAGCKRPQQGQGDASPTGGGHLSYGRALRHPATVEVWARERTRRERISISSWMAIPLIFLGGLVLAMGLYPTPWIDWTAGVGLYLIGLSK
jgi:proton-translocating NADH-quinone oxidoreductase chain N